MKFAIEGVHRQFFRKHQALEVEGMLTKAQLNELNLQIEKGLEERLNTKPKRAFQELPTHIFSYGRDLFRSSDSLKKIILNSQLAEIASELIEFRPLRFGFDQLYCTVAEFYKDRDDFNPFKELALKPKPLKETTCIQGLLCGLMICLSGEEKVVEEEKALRVTQAEKTEEVAQTEKNETVIQEEKIEKIVTEEVEVEEIIREEVKAEEVKAEEVIPVVEAYSIFAKKAGNAVFFTPELPIDFSKLITDDSHRYLLITYTHSTAIYYMEENDPQTHVPKSLGYVFGDRLNDKFNPIIYR